MRSALRNPLSAAIRRPTEAGRRSGASPPSGWVPIQQVPGWSIEYLAPLGDGIVDNGESWVATDHQVTGLDASLYLLAANFRAIEMPSSFPLRITFEQFEDGSDIPLEDLQLPTQMVVQAVSGGGEFPNSNPPTTSYDGSPFELVVEPVPSGGQQAKTSFAISMQHPTAADAGPATVSWEMRIEIQNEGGVWELLQNTDWTFVYDAGSMVDAGDRYTVTNAPSTMDMVMTLSLFDVERGTVPVRITMLSYEVTPDAGQVGTYVSPAILRISAVGDPAVLQGQEVWPPTDFPGTPWTVECPAIVTPFIPPDDYYIGIQANDAAFANTASAGQWFSYILRIEVQLPP